MTRNAIGFAAAALCAVLALSGCATSSSKREEEARLRKARSHLDLGKDYLDNDRVALGLRELMAAEQLDPKNAQIQYALSEAYLRRGKAVEAEGHLHRALELHPEHHDARMHLAALYLNQGRFEESLAQSAVLVDDPTLVAPWRALTNYGVAASALGRGADARAKLELALEYRPSYWPALLRLDIIEAEEGRRLESVSLFEQVLEQKPGPPVESEANHRLCEIHVALGNRARAVSHCKTSVARMPSSPWGKKSEEYLKLLR